MQTEYNFNNPLPFHQRPVARNGYQPVAPRGQHGWHVFCVECFCRVFLGSAAFKVYLLIAWCIGLSGLMYLQKPEFERKRIEGRLDYEKRKPENVIYMVIILIYLFSQIFGLLATVTQCEKIFIPYVIVLFIVSVCNTICCSWAILAVIYKVLLTHPMNLPWSMDPFLFLLVTGAFFCYNLLCFTSVLHLCQRFDQKRLLAERHRRELQAHNARVYERLVRLNAQASTEVVANSDSPPKYSSLDSSSPPPGYSQLPMLEKEGVDGEKGEEKEAKCRRALFQESPV